MKTKTQVNNRKANAATSINNTTKEETKMTKAQLTEREQQLEAATAQMDAPEATTARKRTSDPAVARFDIMIRQHADEAKAIFARTVGGAVLSREKDLEGKKSLASKLAWRMKTAGLLIDTQVNREADKEAKVPAAKNIDRTYRRNPEASAELVALLDGLK